MTRSSYHPVSADEGKVPLMGSGAVPAAGAGKKLTRAQIAMLPRHAHSNNSAALVAWKYPNNYVSTAKYTLFTFLPKNLFEQFSRIANLYFLLISILQLIGNLSPTGKYTTIVPLMIVITVTAIKDAYEDYKRHQADKEVNNRMCTVIRDGRVLTMAWADVHVGDIVHVVCDEPFPADLVFLSSSESHGTCYVETSSLDGETNLKIKSAMKDTASLKTHDEMANVKFEIECEPPNKELYRFEGTLRMGDVHSSVGVESSLLRGMTLKNTKWIYGIVVYSGNDSKLMKNSTAPPHKRSQVERMTNRQIGFIFLLLFVLAFFCAVGLGIWVGQSKGAWYLPDFGEAAAAGAIGFLTFLILFNNLIPISLYVSLEMVKVVQAYLISSDIKMYHADSNTPAQARTSSLNEELGQIQYVFSDKTGTLTQNRLEFLKCSIAGHRYGYGVTEIARAAAKRQGKTLEDPRPEEYKKKGSAGFYDPKLLNGGWKSEPCKNEFYDFFMLLALCHSVVPEHENEGVSNPMRIKYQAASPDDLALVSAARGLGFAFVERTPTSLSVIADGKTLVFELVATLEFNSTRKRMSVILKRADGTYLLLCKGADSVIYPRLMRGTQYADITVDHLQEFASEGLRTLCLAQRVLSADEFRKFEHSYRSASLAISNREELMDRLADEYEQRLELLGATAIEDKLQEGVPDTIEILAKAGIKTWVLTGDKQETAINIGFACALLDDTQELVTINETEASAMVIALARAKEKLIAASKDNRDGGLVIDGDALKIALLPDHRAQLLAVGEMCRSVICCRVSPSQKAEVVKLVRYGRNVVTLAIGDGANDVSMIQAAHVGIGISGLEGMQAARASDYSIAQFRFLSRLLLVHGRWAYRRNSKLILYSFYKNTTMFLTQLWFTFTNGFSGTSLYERWTLAMFNVLFSAFAVLAFAVFDRDVSDAAAVKFPRLYHQGRDNRLFTSKVFWGYVFNAIVHSVICFGIPFLSMSHGTIYADGRSADMYSIGLIVYAGVLATITLKMALETASWTIYNHLATWGSFAAFFIFNIAYTNLFAIMPNNEVSGSYGLFFQVCTSAYFWLIVPLVPVVCLSRDFLYKFYKRHVQKKTSRHGGLLYAVQHFDRNAIFAEETVDALDEAETEPEHHTGLDHYGEHRPVVMHGKMRKDEMIEQKRQTNYTGYSYAGGNQR